MRYLGDLQGRCRCTLEQVHRYKNRLSGPLLDRVDMHIEVPRLPAKVLTDLEVKSSETSESVRKRIGKVRQLQLARQHKINSALGAKELDQYCQLKDCDREFLSTAIKQLGLSARAYHRVLRLTRTIADLATAEVTQSHHITEALSYRTFDRQPRY